jgi:UDP-2,3-diacylglucosamine hydrolase
MQRAYFVSDLHIASPDDPKATLFLAFLRQLTAESASHLVLLGDIFDMWLGDHDYFVDRYRQVIDEIARLRDDGVQVHYFEGNHDLHLGRYWAGRLGIVVHRGPTSLQIAGQTVRLEHGDQMDPDDRGYRFLRWFLRTPVMRFVIYHLPGKLAAAIGERASASSRSYTSETKTISREGAIGKIREHAAKAHAEQRFDLLISGHVHIRDDHEMRAAGGSFRSVNLGTWLDRPCCFRLDAAGGQMVELGEGDMAQLMKTPLTHAKSSL